MIPTEYLSGYTDFLGCRIDLSRRPLIPRVETAAWVEKAIHEIGAKSRYSVKMPRGDEMEMRALDMFAGSGCVGVAVLARVPGVKVDFVDIEPAFLEQVGVNCELNGISKDRYRLIKADVFNSEGQMTDNREQKAEDGERKTYDKLQNYKIPKLQNVFTKYDYILANPPYCLAENLAPEVKEYEPTGAVIGGGSDGLEVIRKFLSEAWKYLKPGGKIYMEHDDFQVAAIAKILRGLPYKKWEFFKDQFGRWRWVEVES